MNERDITIELEREAPEQTKVSVSAKKNLVEWDKDFAKKLVAQIGTPDKG